MRKRIRKQFKRTTFFISFFYGTMLVHDQNKRPHWSWITDQIILGALPIKTKLWKWGGHHRKIITESVQKLKPLGLVISAVQIHELKGQGLPFNPVSTKEWEKLHVKQYQISIPDFSADISEEAVFSAVQLMDKVLKARQTIYIHCKAGRGRSWMVLMCYLTTFGGMTFEDAKMLIQTKRPHVSPSTEQIEFVKNFKKKYKSNKD